ncbi:MAG: hypothetical protein HRU19_13145 [Pseudobacteriovorax sp.]|nr:hypothetical protein [Pseudobacteriovorax sp.]
MKTIASLLMFFLGATSYAQGIELFTLSSSDVAPTHIQCQGVFYQHNAFEAQYSAELAAGSLLVPFDSFGLANQSVLGKHLEFVVYGSFIADPSSTRSPSGVESLSITVEANFLGTSFKALEQIGYLKSQHHPELEIAGIEHLVVGCKPVIVNQND